MLTPLSLASRIVADIQQVLSKYLVHHLAVLVVFRLTDFLFWGGGLNFSITLVPPLVLLFVELV